MNGYTHDPAVFERIANLIEQIPQDVRLEVVGECIPWSGDPHETERNLTGYCIRKAWEQTPRLPFDRDDADILTAARKVSQDAELTTGDMTRQAYGEAQEPRGLVGKVTVSKSFAERWTTNPQHYKDHFGCKDVEVKG